MSSLKTRLKKLSGKNKVSEDSDSDQEYKENESTEEKSASNKGLNDGNSSDFSEPDDHRAKEKNWNSQKKPVGTKVEICYFLYFWVMVKLNDFFT